MPKDHYPSNVAVWLREKLPVPLFIIIGIGAPILIYAFIGAIFVRQFDLAMIIFLVGICPLAFLYFDSTGLKMAWDESRIYMRPQSFRPPQLAKTLARAIAVA